MKRGFWNKRIPTLLGIFVITIGIGITTFLIQNTGIFSIRAALSEEPKDVRISNITEGSFTVSYSTDEKTTGVLSYGINSSFGQSGLDDRDQNSGKIEAYKIHNFTVRNLKPITKYYFVIVSGKQTYTNNSIPFEVTTGPILNTDPPAQDPMSGKIITPNGSAPQEAIVYVVAENSQVLSTLAKNDGSFVLPLNSLRTADLSSYFVLESAAKLKMLSVGDGMSSNVVLSAIQIYPLPVITLSNNYDFTLSDSSVSSESASLEGFPPLASRQTTNNFPKIITPQSNQGFTDQKPQFKGTALPNEEVQIIINSEEQIQTTVSADDSGNWTYRPQSELSPGNHTITIVTKDASGVVKTLKQSFIVYASGSQLPGESGSPTPTPFPSLTQTPTPTIVEQNTELSPTTSPVPTISLLITNTPTPPLPPTGNTLATTAGIIGLFISLIGGLLFLLTRGAI